jgi:hypothetical protein
MLLLLGSTSTVLLEIGDPSDKYVKASSSSDAAVFCTVHQYSLNSPSKALLFKLFV